MVYKYFRGSSQSIRKLSRKLNEELVTNKFLLNTALFVSFFYNLCQDPTFQKDALAISQETINDNIKPMFNFDETTVIEGKPIPKIFEPRKDKKETDAFKEKENNWKAFFDNQVETFTAKNIPELSKAIEQLKGLSFDLISTIKIIRPIRSSKDALQTQKDYLEKLGSKMNNIKFRLEAEEANLGGTRKKKLSAEIKEKQRTAIRTLQHLQQQLESIRNQLISYVNDLISIIPGASSTKNEAQQIKNQILRAFNKHQKEDLDKIFEELDKKTKAYNNAFVPINDARLQLEEPKDNNLETIKTNLTKVKNRLNNSARKEKVEKFQHQIELLIATAEALQDVAT